MYRETGWYVESKEYAICKFIEDMLLYMSHKIQSIPNKEHNVLLFERPPSLSRIEK